MSLHIEVEQDGQALIVRLQGELDHHTAETVKARIEQSLAGDSVLHVILSLKGLQFMDSSGLGVILGRYRQIAAKGGKMAVCDVQPSVRKLLDMSGLFKIVSVHENERQAISSLGVVS